MNRALQAVLLVGALAAAWWLAGAVEPALWPAAGDADGTGGSGAEAGGRRRVVVAAALAVLLLLMLRFARRGGCVEPRDRGG